MPTSRIEQLLVDNEAQRYPDVVYRYRPDRITGSIPGKQGATFLSENRIELKITVVTADILQITYSLEGESAHNFSYAIDPAFEATTPSFEFEELKDHYLITTSSLRCKVMKEKMLVHFYDNEGRALCEDKNGYYHRESLMQGISEISISKKAPKGVSYYGLGDKPFGLNLRGRQTENWNTDAFGYERDDDPVYRSVPFYMALYEQRGYGIFLDNSYRTWFNFDHKKNETSGFAASGGKMNYYFINGPDLVDVTRRYTLLTGTPELPPVWALGYHQCRWSYYPESRVREVAETFREKRIPCDALYLDIDYMDEYRVFTWNTELFPDPGKLIRDLSDKGFRTVVMIDPGIRIDDEYPPFKTGKEKGYFCTRADGDLFIGPVWPPRCVFPDFTNPEVREWWGDLYKEFIADLQIDGIWNDMNEPAVFEVERKTFPDDIRHQYDGHPCSHKKAHNVFGMQMARASLLGIKKQRSGSRPFLLTRASFSGGQRYAALWTGDNIATWDHLKLAMEQCLRLSISGFSFCGSDLGGFSKVPAPELYTRWIQLGIFHPLFRTHSMGYNIDGAAAVQQEAAEAVEETHDREPWSFGKKTTDIAREIIGLRYRLLSYLYTLMREYIVNGTPVLQPLAYHDQHDPEAVAADDLFMFGDKILVSPVFKKGERKREVYLPKGYWYHFWSERKLKGGKMHTVDAPLDQIPFFIRAGSVIPMRELMQYTGEKDPEILTLLVYYSDEAGESFLYEDAEEGYGYSKGEYRYSTFSLTSAGKDKIRLYTDREGSYDPLYDKIELLFIGLPFEPSGGAVDSTKQQPERVIRNGQKAWKVMAGPSFEEVELSI